MLTEGHPSPLGGVETGRAVTQDMATGGCLMPLRVQMLPVGDCL